ncbi:MAG: DUF4372 domain-containing protein [Desulfobacteraceae bacterium]
MKLAQLIDQTRRIRTMAHCNTILPQMLKFIPRHVFAKLDREHGTGRAARSFTRWHQCVHLLFMQLTGRCSSGMASPA